MARFHEAKINNFHFMNFLSWYEIKIDPDDFPWHIKLFHEIDSIQLIDATCLHDFTWKPFLVSKSQTNKDQVNGIIFYLKLSDAVTVNAEHWQKLQSYRCCRSTFIYV